MQKYKKTQHNEININISKNNVIFAIWCKIYKSLIINKSYKIINIK